MHALHAPNDGRRGRRRLGSVLLITIGLLELLALIGAVWIATTRSDRASSIDNVANTQIDLLVEGARNMVIGAVAESPLDQRTVDSQSVAWLADRVPDVSGAAPQWERVSAPLVPRASFTSPLNGTATSVRTAARPTVVTIAGRPYPALELGGKTLLAADTDGDGIADAGLWALPIGQLNGVTYFVAVRIIDHGSALNASVAWKANDEPAYTAVLPGNFFPTNVDLASLLANSAGEMTALNNHRFGGSPPSLTPLDDSGAARNDFAFLSPYDAVWMQLGRRLGHPGYNTPGVRYRAIDLAESVGLANGLVCRAGASASTLESLLTDSLVTGVPTLAYQPDQVAQWAAHFNHAASTFSRRCLLVAANPVTNQISPVTLTDAPTLTAGHPDMRRYPAVPVRTSINTAPFEELWRAFWCAMAKGVGSGTFSTPFGDLGATAFDPYDPAHPQRMFRSSLREMRYTDRSTFDARAARFAPSQQLLLRSALAAMNTVDLRDPDTAPTPRTIRLTARVDGADVPVEATLYGGEPQPFITEVYAHTDIATVPAGASGPNAAGYVALELFNPYRFDIALDGSYRLALIERRPAGATPTTALPTAELCSFPVTGGPVVPAGGYLVLENYKSDDTAPAKYRPVSSGLPLTGDLPAPAAGQAPRNVFCVPNLAGAFDRELVLVRQSAGGPTGIEGLAPIDSFDFTGLVLPTAAPYEVLHYVRNSDLNGRRWACVYPGRYDGTKTRQRQEGTQQDPFDVTTTTEPNLLVAAALGAPDAAPSYPNPFIPIQWCNADTPGPLPLSTATGNLFPFGGFARLGDILQVPFIGRYVVRPVGAAPGTVLEMNSVSMDCSFADDGFAGDDNVENVGRFCPTFATGSGSTPPSSGGFDLSKCPRGMEPTLRVTKPSVPGTVEVINEAHGGFEATLANSLKGYFTSLQDGFDPGIIRFINCGGGDITRRPCPPEPAPVHTDVFFTNGRKFHRDVVVEYIDCAAWNTEGEAFFWESGSLKRFLMRNCWINNPYHINYIEINLNDDCIVEEVVLDGGHSFDRNGNKIPMNLHFTVKGVKKNGKCLRVYRNNDVGGRKATITGYPPVQIIDGLPPDLGGATPTGADYYAWASDVLDYFTAITNANDDYLPNHVQASFVDPSSGAGGPLPATQPVPNDPAFTVASANGDRENAVGVEGLVNVNTAPWKVLAAVPFIPGDAAANESLARAIVAHRQNSGPFANLFELFQVPEFKAAADAIVAGAEPDDEQGEFSPRGAGATDKVRGDFEERFLLMTRVSNLLTVRSDSFTAYLVVQGWRGAGTAAPQLVVQRRLGMLIDRTPVTPSSRAPRVTTFPLN